MSCVAGRTILLNHKLSETFFTKLFQELNHSMNRELNDVIVTHFVLKTGAKSKKYVFLADVNNIDIINSQCFCSDVVCRKFDHCSACPLLQI